MNSKYQTAGKGIYFMFAGEILALLSAFPFFGIIALIASGLLSIYGLYTMAKADEGYKTALTLTVAGVVLELAASILLGEGGLLNFLVNAVVMLIRAMIIYQICGTTAALLNGIDSQIARLGENVWKTVFFCTIVWLVCEVLALIPIINVVALVLAALISIVQFVIGILYLVFLYKSQKVLKNC